MTSTTLATRLLISAVLLVPGASRAVGAAGAERVEPPLRVACLGDSITVGAQVVDREHNAYPRQLQYRLGSGYAVRNFGAGGAPLLRGGQRPYVEASAFADALAWKPDVAVVILGTNDTCLGGSRRDWEHEAELEDDARYLLGRLREASPRVRVLLCSPPPMFPETRGLSESRADDLRQRAPRLARVAAALRAVAAETERAAFLDLSRVLSANQVTDGVHTTPFGAEAIAARIFEAIVTPTAPPLDLAGALESAGVAVSHGAFHGFARLDFPLPEDGAACTLVAPHAAAEGHPWIWRARFFGHQPGLDLELLDRGFHLAYCDVAGLYGAPPAVRRWERFHALCVRLGLSRRVVLEGLSRGGLPVLGWGAAHPEHVVALYGDNPVCDVRSWPGGRSGKRSDADWRRCLEAWELDEERAWHFELATEDRLRPLAQAGVPLLLVLGGADNVVPPAENGLLLAERYRALDGPVEVWLEPGKGHHPHGLHPPAPLRRAILRAAGFERMPTTRAVPSAEYRGRPAGWSGRTWWEELGAMRSLATEHPDLELVFLGDSITQGLTGATDRLAGPDGSRPFDRLHGRRGAVSLGLSGDRTEHLLYRIEHGALATLDPGVIVLQIGVNNVNSAGHTGAETAAGVAAVVHALREHEPQARIVIAGPFPLGPDPRDSRRLAIDRVHALIAPLADDERVFYLDPRPLFLDEEGRPNERMSPDYVHVTGAGQRAWLLAIEPLVARLLDE